MSKELDFNVKYQGHYKDGFEDLGESINEMSEKLEETITELKSANIELKKDIAKKEEVDENEKELSMLPRTKNSYSTDSGICGRSSKA
ncbi:MAG: hypothetical protein V8R90_10000 [Eubacterium sp.]